MVRFKVVAVSVNTNTFGLRGVVLLARDGTIYQVGASHLHVPQQGQVINVPGEADNLNWGHVGYEIPERLADAPPAVIAEVWGGGDTRKGQ